MSIQIDLWLWPLDPVEAAVAEHAAILSDDEAGRARAFVKPDHARAYTVARGHMRRILAGYTGADPAQFGFAYTPQRKPWLPGGPVFNLSHSGGWAALAVSADTPLGVDIEAHRAVEYDVPKRFFSKTENDALQGLTGADWQLAFFRSWTRKEALVKALGDGLSMPLDRFDVSHGTQARLTRLDHAQSAASDWSLLNLDLGPEMSGALAVQARGQGVTVNLREGQMPLQAVS